MPCVLNNVLSDVYFCLVNDKCCTATRNSATYIHFLSGVSNEANSAHSGDVGVIVAITCWVTVFYCTIICLQIWCLNNVQCWNTAEKEMNAESIAPHSRMSLLNKIYSYFPWALVNKVPKMMGELLRGWCLSAVQKSSPKFRHFSKTSLIHLNVTGLQTWAETPARTHFSAALPLLRFPLENREAMAHRTQTISGLKIKVGGVLKIGRDLGWRSIFLTGFKQWKILV